MPTVNTEAVTTLRLKARVVEGADEERLLVGFEQPEVPFSFTVEGRRDFVLQAFDVMIRFARAVGISRELSTIEGAEMNRMFEEASQRLSAGETSVELESEVAG